MTLCFLKFRRSYVATIVIVIIIILDVRRRNRFSISHFSSYRFTSNARGVFLNFRQHLKSEAVPVLSGFCFLFFHPSIFLPLFFSVFNFVLEGVNGSRCDLKSN